MRLRRAAAEDVPFLAGLVAHEEVEPFLATIRARDPAAIALEVERSRAQPAEFGRFVIEAREEGSWSPAGALGFELVNRRSAIAQLDGLAVHPDFRGRGLADEAARLVQRHLLVDLGYHRLQLECYGFNGRAIRHAERAGFVREGVKRRAYRRHGGWADSVLFSFLREDLDEAERAGEAPAGTPPAPSS